MTKTDAKNKVYARIGELILVSRFEDALALAKVYGISTTEVYDMIRKLETDGVEFNSYGGM